MAAWTRPDPYSLGETLWLEPQHPMAGRTSFILPLAPHRMDLHTFRAERQRKTDNLLAEDHRDLKRFFALDSAAYRDGALDGKTKELLGLVASTVLRCNDCIAYHCDQAVQAGWSREEILDALNVALVVGGSITIPHIRTVWEVVDQLFDEKAAKEKSGDRTKEGT